MRRYYKSTDGHITVFRSSETRVYKSASFSSVEGKLGYVPQGLISFHGQPVPYWKYPVEEITQSEYEALQARKVSRLKAWGLDPKYASSQDSWVGNSAL